MEGKKLTSGEALDIVLNGGAITDITKGCKFTLDNFMEVSGGDLKLLLNNDWYEYTEPPKPKNLLERFASRYDIRLTYDSGHIYTIRYAEISTDDVINWLDKQPESRLKVLNQKLSERFLESFKFVYETQAHLSIPISDIYNWLKEQEDES